MGGWRGKIRRRTLDGFPSGDRNLFGCLRACGERERDKDIEREREFVCTGRTEALFRLKQVKKVVLICCVCTSTALSQVFLLLYRRQNYINTY